MAQEELQTGSTTCIHNCMFLFLHGTCCEPLPHACRGCIYEYITTGTRNSFLKSLTTLAKGDKPTYQHPITHEVLWPEMS